MVRHINLHGGVIRLMVLRATRLGSTPGGIKAET